MRIVSWNVNGIRANHNKGYFLPLIEKMKPDILCLQETKAERGQVEIDLPQYEEYWNSAKRKGYSGTALLSRTIPCSVSFNFPERLVKKYELVDGYGDLNSEGRIIVAEFDSFHLATVYTPNAKPDLSRLDLRYRHWDPAFLEYMRKLNKAKPVIFCGDLNVAHTPDDLTNPKANEGEHGYTKEERTGLDRVIEAGFVDTFRMFQSGNGYYTWWSNFSNARARNVGWRIDYFFVGELIKERVKKASILSEYYGSDHCPILIDIDL